MGRHERNHLQDLRVRVYQADGMWEGGQLNIQSYDIKWRSWNGGIKGAYKEVLCDIANSPAWASEDGEREEPSWFLLQIALDPDIEDFGDKDFDHNSAARRITPGNALKWFDDKPFDPPHDLIMRANSVLGPTSLQPHAQKHSGVEDADADFIRRCLHELSNVEAGKGQCYYHVKFPVAAHVLLPKDGPDFGRLERLEAKFMDRVPRQCSMGSPWIPGGAVTNLLRCPRTCHACLEEARRALEYLQVAVRDGRPSQPFIHPLVFAARMDRARMLEEANERRQERARRDSDRLLEHFGFKRTGRGLARLIAEDRAGDTEASARPDTPDDAAANGSSTSMASELVRLLPRETGVTITDFQKAVKEAGQGKLPSSKPYLRKLFRELRVPSKRVGTRRLWDAQAAARAYNKRLGSGKKEKRKETKGKRRTRAD